METGIRIDGASADVHVAHVAAAIVALLEAAHTYRTSESVLSHALQVLGQGAEMAPVSITGCTIESDKQVHLHAE